MWLRQSALLTWPLYSAAIGLICLSDTTRLCFSVFVLGKLIERPPVWTIYKQENEKKSPKTLPFDNHNPCFAFCLFLFPPLFQPSIFSQTISGLRKESVYSVAKACWNHAVFPLAKPAIATPWFAYFPGITRLKQKKDEVRKTKKHSCSIIWGFYSSAHRDDSCVNRNSNKFFWGLWTPNSFLQMSHGRSSRVVSAHSSRRRAGDCSHWLWP